MVTDGNLNGVAGKTASASSDQLADTRIKHFLLATWNGNGDPLDFVVRYAETTDDFRSLAELAKDRQTEVRLAVADNHHCSFETILLLSKDPHADVRYLVAENAHTPAHILKNMTEDENPYVANRADKTLKRLECVAPAQLHIFASQSKAWG